MSLFLNKKYVIVCVCLMLAVARPGAAQALEAESAPLALSFTKNAPSGGDLSGFNLSLSHDLLAGSRFQPFVTAGFGAGFGGGWHAGASHIAATRNYDRDLGRAWTAGAGLSFAVSDRTRISGGYHFSELKDLGFGGIRTKIKSHEFRIGITIKLTPAALER